MNCQRERRSWLLLGSENVFVGIQDQVIFHLAADLRIAAGRGNGDLLRPRSADAQIEAHRQRGSVKGRTEVSGSCRQTDAEFGHRKNRLLALGSWLLTADLRQNPRSHEISVAFPCASVSSVARFCGFLNRRTSINRSLHPHVARAPEASADTASGPCSPPRMKCHGINLHDET